MRCRFGHEVKAFAVIGSTQTEAKRLAEAGASEGTLVIAERQRKGRGRLGRSWASPPGGLWCSLVLRPPILPAVAPQLTLVASLAVTDTIAKVTGLRPAIQWPNDVIVEGKKVCGILTEMGIQGDRLQWAIVGIGINVNNEIPPSLIHRAISLQAVVGRPVDSKRLLQHLMERLETLYPTFLQEGFAALRPQYRERCLWLHQRVRVEQLRRRGRWRDEQERRASDGETYEGIVTDIDAEGALLLQSADHRQYRILTGDVTLLGGE